MIKGYLKFSHGLPEVHTEKNKSMLELHNLLQYDP